MRVSYSPNVRICSTTIGLATQLTELRNATRGKCPVERSQRLLWNVSSVLHESGHVSVDVAPNGVALNPTAYRINWQGQTCASNVCSTRYQWTWGCLCNKARTGQRNLGWQSVIWRVQRHPGPSSAWRELLPSKPQWAPLLRCAQHKTSCILTLKQLQILLPKI